MTAAEKSAILERVIRPAEPSLTPHAARAILSLAFSTSDETRINQLAAKNRRGKLKRSEREELGWYVEVGQFLALMQAKARKSLQSRK